jgi:hypothetical protein
MHGISSLSEELLPSQERLHSMEIATYYNAVPHFDLTINTSSHPKYLELFCSKPTQTLQSHSGVYSFIVEFHDAVSTS